MAYFSNQIRVTYGDTDQMGIVYHANYLNYFEISRTEMMRAQGLTYRQLEATGIFLQVVHCELDFHRPAHYDDLLEVRSSISSLGKASLVIVSEVWLDGTLLVTGKVKLAALSRSSGRIVPLPPELTSAVNQFCVSSDK
ncbi:MAG: acyl-CoA thioesterase [Victivallales bacterium]|nr:acyl-CoA thioesterase [Victivallales bacterium]